MRAQNGDVTNGTATAESSAVSQEKVKDDNKEHSKRSSTPEHEPNGDACNGVEAPHAERHLVSETEEQGEGVVRLHHYREAPRSKSKYRHNCIDFVSAFLWFVYILFV